MEVSNVLGFFSVAIEIVMVLLNLLPIYAGGYVKAKRDTSEIDEILIALSSCTICFVLFSTPFGLMTYFRKTKDGGTETCAMYQVTATWYQIFCVVIITTLAINCVRRGQILIKSQFMHRIWSRQYSLIIIIFIIIFSLIVAILPRLGLAPEMRNLTDSNKTCQLWISLHSDDQREQVFLITYLLIGYLQIICLIICVPMIFHYIRRVKRQFCIDLCAQESNFLMERDVIRRRYIDRSRMVTLMAAMFYFSWIPLLIMVTLGKIGHAVSETAILYAMLGTSMTGLLNPLAYAYWDKSYRGGYKKALERVLLLCTCSKLKTENMPAVSLKETSISQTANMSVMNNSDPQTSDPYTNSMLSERTEPGTVNPACENLVDDSCENIIDNDNIEVSFMGSNADERLVDENVGDDTYSVESESEIFITERRLELRNQDSPQRRLSETSDSSALTDDDSLGAYYSDNEHYIDESIM